MHQPERVMRQFGFRQQIPPQSNAIHPSHRFTFRNGQKHWGKFHEERIQRWDDRMAHVVPEGEPDLTDRAYPIDDPYVIWYHQITRRYISLNGAAMDGAMRCFEFLRRTDLLPLTPQQYGEVGAIGLKHLARLKTHVRKKPPVHRPPRAPAPQAMNAQPGIDEVQEHVDQFGVEVPQEGEAGQPQEWQQEQHQQQADVPHHQQQAEMPMPNEVRTHDPVDNPIFTPDHLQFSPSYLSHILSTTVDTTSPEWDNLDVEGVGDPNTTFDDSQLVLNRRKVGETSLGDQGGEGGGDITQLGPHVEPVVDPDGDVDAEGDTDMEEDHEVENEEVGGQDSGLGEVTQDATPPRPRRSKRPHPGARPCGTDHGKEEKKKGGKKRKLKGG